MRLFVYTMILISGSAIASGDPFPKLQDGDAKGVWEGFSDNKLRFHYLIVDENQDARYVSSTIYGEWKYKKAELLIDNGKIVYESVLDDKDERPEGYGDTKIRLAGEGWLCPSSDEACLPYLLNGEMKLDVYIDNPGEEEEFYLETVVFYIIQGPILHKMIYELGESALIEK